jgi:NTP pyrophosphatase (non-canonical NTP hydrolase)
MIEHPNDYQKQTGLTAVYPPDRALEYLTLGLVGEAGEVANKLKKVIRGDYQDPKLGSHIPEDVRDKLVDELGDVLWYVAQLSIVLDIRLSSVMEQNILKLQQRKENNTLKGDSRSEIIDLDKVKKLYE